MEFFNKYIGVVSAIMVLMLIVFFHHEIIWDEQWYVDLVGLLEAKGFTIKFLLLDPAAPMHAVLHYFLSPITHLQSPQIRLANLALCVGICFFLYLILKMEKLTSDNILPYSFSIFILPGFFVLAFFAITEAPCLLWYSISLFLLIKYITSEKQNLLHIILSGLFLGLAVLTRQLFLVCIGPVLVMMLYKQFKNRLLAIILFVTATVLVVGPIFYLWKGIVPPASLFRASAAAATEKFSIKHVFLSFGYSFFYVLVIMPAYFLNFIKNNWKIITGIAVIGFIASTFIRDDSFVPMSGLLPHVFSPSVVEIISFSFFKIVGITSLILLYFLLSELFRNRHDFKQVFLILSMLSILVTPAIILDQFSSRYSMQIAPLLVLFAYTRIKPIKPVLQFGINWIAIAINIISVITFFIY